MCQKVAVSDLRFVVLSSFNLTKIRIQQKKQINHNVLTVIEGIHKEREVKQEVL
jgi:hypothetical protein